MSIRFPSLAMIVVLVFSAAPARAQASPPPGVILETPADYLSGQPGVKKRIVDGMLVLDAASLVYVERHEAQAHGYGRSRGARIPRFTIPLAIITKVSNTVDTNGPNGAAVAAFGMIAMGTKRQDEYVFVTTETETTTDVVIFKVMKNTSAATAAKVAFAAKKARAGALD